MQKLIRLYIDQKIEHNKMIFLNDNQTHYLYNVMRKKISDNIKIFDNISGEWLSSIIDISKKKAIIEPISNIIKFDESIKINVIFSLIKHHKLSFIVEKATELGATDLYPVITDRSNYKLFNLEKFRLTSIEASEQSERISIPNISPLQPLNKLMEDWNSDNIILFCDETLRSIPIYKELKLRKTKEYSILIGPEGGFSDIEQLYLRKLDFISPIHLGKNILKSETAIVSALSCIQNYLYV